MATKTGLISAINTQLTAIITQAKVRAAALLTVDEMYPNSVTDSQTTETYTTKAGTNITYSIRIIKTGNVARVKITLTNTTTSVLSSQNVFTWKSTEFRPKSGVNDFKFTAVNSSSVRVGLYLSNNIIAVNSMPPSGSFSSEFITYITQD